MSLYCRITHVLAAGGLALVAILFWSGTAAAQSSTYDPDRPTVRISSAASSPTNTFPIPVAIVFSEPVFGFDVTDISVQVGTVTRLATKDRVTYLARIAPESDGELVVHIPAGAVTDETGRANIASGQFSVVSDTTKPVVVAIDVDEHANSSVGDYPFYVNFSEPVNGVGASDFKPVTTGDVVGQVLGVSGAGMSYTVRVAVNGGHGSLALSLRDDDSISDLATNKLGGEGPGNGDFLGASYSIGGNTPHSFLTIIDGLDPGPGELDGNVGPGTIVGPVLTLDCDENDDGVADRAFLLQDIVEVHDGGVLRIEAGCFIYADASVDPATLLVRRGGRIEAVGTPEAPVVFLSANDTRTFDVGAPFQSKPGDPQPGDWGGLIIIGAGTCNGYNDTSPTGTAGDGIPGDCEVPALDDTFPGIDYVDAIDAGGKGRLLAGLHEPHDAGSSGSLRFVRVEHAGRSGLPLIGLFAVGSGTVIENIHARSGSNAGLDIRGGSVNIRNVMVSNVALNALQFAQGWNGDAQFIVVRYGTAVDVGYPVGIAGVNNTSEATDLTDADHALTRRTAPRLFNFTVLGPGTGTAMRVFDGAAGHYRNGLAAGWQVGLDIDGSVAYAGCDGTAAGALFIDDLTFSDGTVVPRTGELSAIDADNESTCTGGGVAIGLTLLSAAANARAAFNPQPIEAAPAAAPPAGSVFDTTAAYRGAVSPIGTPFYLRGRWAGLQDDTR